MQDFNDYNPINRGAELSDYFSTLPVFVQETIRQSAGDIHDETALRSFAQHLMNE